MINPNAIRAVFERSLKLNPEETCLIVTDTEKEHIGRAFYEYAKTCSKDQRIIVINPTKEHGAEPPFDIAEEMLFYDVQLLITSKSLTHTFARRQATANGARIATMPSITEEIANRCLDIDYDALKKNSNNVHELLKASKEVRITTSLGTDIRFVIGSSGYFGKDGGSFDFPGAYGNLPEGEVAFAPESAEGIYIVDASMCGLGLLSSPLTFEVSSGVVTKISGARSEELIMRMDDVGDKAYVVAELGIGLNPKAKIIGNILEDEKVIGTVHVAVGNNCSFGRYNDVPLHLDGVIMSPDIFIDGRSIMEKGRFIEGLEA